MIDRPHRHIETGTAGAGGHRQGEGNGKNERCLLYRSRPHCALHHDNCSFSCCRRDVVEPAAPFFAALTEISSRLGQCGVPLARGGSRSRGARHRRVARTRQSGGPDADAQASQEAGLRADCHRDGQVAIVSSGVRGARSGGLAERCASAEPMKPLAAIFMNFICRGAQFRRAFIRAARLLAYRGSMLARIR
jgi:hypothetical protein